MSDPRSSLFSEIHRVWLKPLGFRKSARKSLKELGDGSALAVTLESYPATPGGPYHFSIEVRATWDAGTPNSIVYCLYLPSYLTKEQFWIIKESTNVSELQNEIKQQFEAVAVPAIHRMHSLEGLLELFRSIPSHVSLRWYYHDFFNLLNRLGKREEGRALLQKVIDTADAGAKERAAMLLAQNGPSTWE